MENKPTKYGSVIAELEQGLTKMLALQGPLAMRQVRVTRHPPGGTPIDITLSHADALREAADGLHKAVLILKRIDGFSV